MQTTPLARLCTIVNTQTMPMADSSMLCLGLENLESGRLTRVSGGNAADNISSKFVFKQGDVLYGTTSALSR